MPVNMELDVQLDDEVHGMKTNRHFIISSTDYRIESDWTFDSWVGGKARI